MAEYWLLVCALACSSVGAWWATSDPTSRRVRRIEFLAWILGIVGAVTLADQQGVSRPWPTAALVVGVMVLVLGLPALVATVIRNRKPLGIPAQR
jgi:FtsH-binding integral membrane protein